MVRTHACYIFSLEGVLLTGIQ